MPSEPHRSVSGPRSTHDEHAGGFSPPKTPLHTISEHSQDGSASLRRQRNLSEVSSPELSRRSLQHQESGRDPRHAAGVAGAADLGAVAAYELSRDDPESRAKSLGKSKANTKSSRSLRRATFDPVVPSSSTHDPSAGKGKEAVRDMSDVYVSLCFLPLSVNLSVESLFQPLTFVFTGRSWRISRIPNVSNATSEHAQAAKYATDKRS